MDARTILPLLDLFCLSVGALVGLLSQMEHVTSIPIALAQVGQGSAIVTQGEFVIVTLSEDGMTLDGEPVSSEELPAAVAGRQVVLRPAGDMPTQETLWVLAQLAKTGADVSIEVKEVRDGVPSGPQGG